jgi:hypothetical protein
MLTFLYNCANRLSLPGKPWLNSRQLTAQHNGLVDATNLGSMSSLFDPDSFDIDKFQNAFATEFAAKT